MKIHTTQKIAGIAVSLGFLVAFAAPALAVVDLDTGANATMTPRGGSVSADLKVAPKYDLKANVKRTAAATTAVSRADAAIDKRIADLNTLIDRLGEMKHITTNAKSNLSTSARNEINNLTTLRAKIDADVDAATIAVDVKLITQDERVYMLVLPQIRISAAAERINTLADMMSVFNTKIQTRVTAAQAAGNDVSAITAAQTDMAAKIYDAKAQASAGVNATSGLVPDNGDKTVMASNAAALKGARADIVAAQKDLVAARKDITVIIKAIKGFNMKVSASADASASATSGTTQQ